MDFARSLVRAFVDTAREDRIKKSRTTVFYQWNDPKTGNPSRRHVCDGKWHRLEDFTEGEWVFFKYSKPCFHREDRTHHHLGGSGD